MDTLQYTAFEGGKIVAQGSLEEVALKLRKRTKDSVHAGALIFSDATGKQMDLDLRGSEAEILDRLRMYLPQINQGPSEVGPGRPRLGVVAREVSLLPRHWEWLAAQTGGSSAALRRLVEQARKNSSGKDAIKEAQERTHQVMSALAGDLPHYEDALRSLYAKDKKKFHTLIREWPSDIRDHVKKLAGPAWIEV